MIQLRFGLVSFWGSGEARGVRSPAGRRQRLSFVPKLGSSFSFVCSYCFGSLSNFLVRQRRPGAWLSTQRVPGRHEQIQHYREHVPRHALALRPAPHPQEERHHSSELACFTRALGRHFFGTLTRCNTRDGKRLLARTRLCR
jgi:hypothetical protein